MDHLVSQQLFASVTNQEGTNFNLIAKDGKVFPVHKWILAARSNVFEAMFRDDLEAVNSSHFMEFTSNEIEQFIRFVYTGEFEMVATNELMQLAINYKLKNLENLLLAASQEISADKMALIAMHLRPGTHAELCKLEISRYQFY